MPYLLLLQIKDAKSMKQQKYVLTELGHMVNFKTVPICISSASLQACHWNLLRSVHQPSSMKRIMSLSLCTSQVPNNFLPDFSAMGISVVGLLCHTLFMSTSILSSQPPLLHIVTLAAVPQQYAGNGNVALLCCCMTY